MPPFEAVRVTQSVTMTLDAAPETVFPLLCPVREYEWIPVWQCEMIYSESGRAEDNCIFLTEFPGDRGREIWSVSRYEPDRAIEFVRVTPDVKLTRLNIHLTPRGNKTLAVWTRIVTALSPSGNAVVESFRKTGYEAEVRMMEKMLNHFLITGSALDIPDYLSGGSSATD